MGIYQPWPPNIMLKGENGHLYLPGSPVRLFFCGGAFNFCAMILSTKKTRVILAHQPGKDVVFFSSGIVVLNLYLKK